MQKLVSKILLLLHLFVSYAELNPTWLSKRDLPLQLCRSVWHHASLICASGDDLTVGL